VLLALAAGGAAFFLLSQAEMSAGQAGLQKVPVVVAVHEIPARKPLEAVDLTIREVPLDPTNERGIFSDPGLLTGRVLAVPALQGQMVTANMLASTASGDGGFTLLGPTETVAPESEAWRAVSLSVPAERAAGGNVGPDMTVDILATLTVNVPQELAESGRYYTDKATKITYQNILILSKAESTYVLKVPLAIAEEMAHLQATGSAQFTMLLRPEQDLRYADASKLGATTNMLIERYGLPLPEPYPPGRGPVRTPEPTPTPSSPVVSAGDPLTNPSGSEAEPSTSSSPAP
jgi:Flp pilus assembly protein CpaB